VRRTAVLVAEFPPLPSFVMAMFHGRKLASLCALNPDNPAANTCLCSEFSLCSD